MYLLAKEKQNQFIDRMLQTMIYYQLLRYGTTRVA